MEKQQDIVEPKMDTEQTDVANGQQTKKKKKKRPKPMWLRVILKTLRLLLVPTLCTIALVTGLAIGYVKLGGGELSDVFEWGTWKHMYDLVFG